MFNDKIYFLAFADAATEPQDFPIAPAYAVPKVIAHLYLLVIVNLSCIKIKSFLGQGDIEIYCMHKYLLFIQYCYKLHCISYALSPNHCKGMHGNYKAWYRLSL